MQHARVPGPRFGAATRPRMQSQCTPEAGDRAATGASAAGAAAAAAGLAAGSRTYNETWQDARIKIVDFYNLLIKLNFNLLFYEVNLIYKGKF